MRPSLFCAQGYCNKVTQKSAAFGGPADEYVLCGSDDWGVYIWHLGARTLHIGERVSGASVSHHYLLSPICVYQELVGCLIVVVIKGIAERLH